MYAYRHIHIFTVFQVEKHFLNHKTQSLFCLKKIFVWLLRRYAENPANMSKIRNWIKTYVCECIHVFVPMVSHKPTRNSTDIMIYIYVFDKQQSQLERPTFGSNTF